MCEAERPLESTNTYVELPFVTCSRNDVGGPLTRALIATE